MNPILKPIVQAMIAELQRQHNESGPSDLAIGFTDEPSVVQLHGPVDLEHLAQATWDAVLTQADKTVHDIVRDMTGEGSGQAPMKTEAYVYDCDRGQGMVMASSLDRATRRARIAAGMNDTARNVRLATKEELAFRFAMGGTNAG